MKLLNIFFIALFTLTLSAFAQANICIPMWWETATDTQVKVQAEWYQKYQPDIARTVINDDCPDNYKVNRSAFMVAIRNSRNVDTLQAVFEHFDVQTRQIASAIFYVQEQITSSTRTLDVILSGGTSNLLSRLQEAIEEVVANRDPYNRWYFGEDPPTIFNSWPSKDYIIIDESDFVDTHRLLQTSTVQQAMEDLIFSYQVFQVLIDSQKEGPSQ